MPGSDLPSLDVVRAELDLEQRSYDVRAAALDSKIGVALAADGVLIVLRPATQTPWDVLAALSAAASALLLVWAYQPRVSGAISPRVLRDRYLTTEAQETKLRVLDTRLQIHADDEEQLKDKAVRFRIGTGVLALAVLLAAAGSTLAFLTS